MKKKVLIPIFLAALALPLGFAKSPVGVDAQFIGQYNDNSSYVKYASEINAQLADEGFVLLKNDGFLPMQTDGAMVTIAGRSAFSLARGGAGSGSGSIANGVKSFDLESSLTAVGATVNQTIKAFYASNNKSGIGRTNGNDGWKGNSQVQIGETPVELYTDELIDSMDEYNDVAIQVITREGSEGCDVKAVDARDFDPRANGTNVEATPLDEITKKHALQLSDNEADLFELLKKHFDHIIIVINSSNVFECDVFQKDKKVSGILWIGNPGDVGPGAVGRILSGEVNPSGRTVDTWARDFTKDPTFQNFSDNAQTNEDIIHVSTGKGADTYAAQDTMFNADGTPTHSYGTDKNYKLDGEPRWLDEDAQVVQGGLNGVKPSAYVSYEEGIYYDYRYYETKYDDMAAKSKSNANKWYKGKEGVVYPFGYGLSYTTFEQKIVESNIENKCINSGNAEISVTVNVKNTGDVAGKDVVQLYWNAPYVKGGIEKASKVLCAFDKTDLLEPGEEQQLTLKFYSQDMANYDFNDANGNNFKGYELDGGYYKIILGKNAHDVYDSIDFQVANEGIQYPYDRYTGTEVKNRFTDRGFYDCLPGEDDFEFTQFSRANFAKTFPTHPTIADRTLGENSRMEEFLTHEFTIKEIEIDKNFEYVPEAVYKTEADIKTLGWSQAPDKTSVPVTIKFTEMLNSEIDDPRWTEFMNQLTYAEMIEYVYGPREHNAAISRLDKPSTSDSDGPQRFRTIWWVSSPIIAATFNVELAKKQGECVGMEAHISGTYGWAGPGVNIHRSPFGGRNFEYYSADPFLTGRIAGRVVAGASDKGVYCYFKHFVVNDQEKNREGTSTFLTEQDLREIYLKAFQLVIQEGKAFGLMSSYNRLGNMETAASYPLLTEVLREEWGFKGAIISDMTHSGNSSVNFKCYENINNRVLAGCNQQLDNGGGFKNNIDCSWDNEKGCPTFKTGGVVYESYSWWYAVRKCAQEHIWMCARSGVNSKTFIQPVNGILLSNVVREVYEGEIGKEVDIEIALPANYANAQVSIDPFTPLPEGLTFNGTKISGTVNKAVNKFIHILVTNGSTTEGASFELRIYAKGVNAELGEMEPKPKQGCGGEVVSVSILLGVIALAGAGYLLFHRRRKETI